MKKERTRENVVKNIYVFNSKGEKVFTGTRKQASEKFGINTPEISTLIKTGKLYKKEIFFRKEDTAPEVIPDANTIPSLLYLYDSVTGKLLGKGSLDIIESKIKKISPNLLLKKTCIRTLIQTSFKKNSIIDTKYIVSDKENWNDATEKKRKYYLYDVKGKLIAHEPIKTIASMYGLNISDLRNSLYVGCKVSNSYYLSNKPVLSLKGKNKQELYLFDLDGKFLEATTNKDFIEKYNLSTNVKIYYCIRHKVPFNNMFYLWKTRWFKLPSNRPKL